MRGVLRFERNTSPSVLQFRCAFSISMTFGLTFIQRVAFLVLGDPAFWRYMLLLATTYLTHKGLCGMI